MYCRQRWKEGSRIILVVIVLRLKNDFFLNLMRTHVRFDAVSY